MLTIVPSILTNNPSELKQMIGVSEEVVERISIDVIDGVFHANKTITPEALSYVETNLLIDYQLMVKEPINWVEKCFRAQADRIVGHIEMMTSQIEFVKKIQGLGCKAGLALDIDTPVIQLDRSLITDLDVIYLMSYKAGIPGQKLQDSVLSKINELAEIRKDDNTPFVIHVDGGVNRDTISKISDAGADEVSVGRLLFNGNMREMIDELERMIS